MAVRAIFTALMMLVLMVVYSWYLSLIVFLFIIPLGICARYFMSAIKNITMVIQKEKSVMNTIAEESFSNIRTVKAFSNEKAEIDKFKLANLAVFGKGKSKAWLQSF